MKAPVRQRTVPRRNAIRGTAVILIATAFLAAACDPFFARVKGGFEGRPDWEMGVKF